MSLASAGTPAAPEPLFVERDLFRDDQPDAARDEDLNV